MGILRKFRAKISKGNPSEISGEEQVLAFLTKCKGVILERQESVEGTWDVVLSDSEQVFKIFYNSSEKPEKVAIYNDIESYCDQHKTLTAS